MLDGRQLHGRRLEPLSTARDGSKWLLLLVYAYQPITTLASL